MTQHEDDEDQLPHSHKAGEGWVVTFADMMSLLMSFFVLMLSFSEQDAAKFKEVGGSLEQAFGVQRDIVSYQMPKGTSIVAREFSPGKPKPTVLNEVRQSTMDDISQTLEFDEKDRNETRKNDELSGPQKGQGVGNATLKTTSNAAAIAEKISKQLANEITQGKVQVGTKNQRVIIRVLDQGSFASGDDSLRPAYEPVLDKIADILENVPGEITISGHTDDKPISNKRFRSNWELSSARAITVAHKLYQRGIDKSRMVVSGMADTQPLYPNDTDEHRSHNRRVEIVITQNDQPRLRDVPEYNDADKYQPSGIPEEIEVNQPAAKSLPKTKGESDAVKTQKPQTEETSKQMPLPQPLKDIQEMPANPLPAAK
ncbi:MAG: hypothetical protein BGO43_09230 [Gammaproteobacteria bacterium 39-13]|nr:type VI secretion system protein TssL, long form [Gammaproteobacteria bacterium]OJV93824.1 MAG: hypothetical protein BGO43_09230 [Gammaproteobacteria bacterium 39-13]